MSVVSSAARAVYDFFTEDGSIVIGAVIAVILVAILTIRKPFPHAEYVAGPLLFVLIAVILIASLWRAAQHSRARSRQ